MRDLCRWQASATATSTMAPATSALVQASATTAISSRAEAMATLSFAQHWVPFLRSSVSPSLSSPPSSAGAPWHVFHWLRRHCPWAPRGALFGVVAPASPSTSAPLTHFGAMSFPLATAASCLCASWSAFSASSSLPLSPHLRHCLRFSPAGHRSRRCHGG